MFFGVFWSLLSLFLISLKVLSKLCSLVRYSFRDVKVNLDVCLFDTLELVGHLGPRNRLSNPPLAITVAFGGMITVLLIYLRCEEA